MLIIKAIIRIDHGKGASRRLRLANKLPAIVYGGTKAPVAITLDQNIILNIQTKEGFYNKVLTLVINDESSTVKVQAVQRHPFKPKLTHIDFMYT